MFSLFQAQWLHLRFDGFIPFYHTVFLLSLTDNGTCHNMFLFWYDCGVLESLLTPTRLDAQQTCLVGFSPLAMPAIYTALKTFGWSRLWISDICIYSCRFFKLVDGEPRAWRWRFCTCCLSLAILWFPSFQEPPHHSSFVVHVTSYVRGIDCQN